LQFPLPEVVVIHRDPSRQEQLKQLESYILEELNVKKLTLASEDSKYGVHLQGEPDNERLGKRLKGDFKKVAPAIKALTSEQLTMFQESGEITMEGHTLSLEDIKVCKYEVIACMRCFIEQSIQSMVESSKLGVGL
jgi:isoleucyl-tRNA synthetase